MTMPINKMKMYDSSKRMADVTPENVHEFVDWWLFRKAYEALHFDQLNRQIDLEESVKIILAQNNISVELVPVVLAKAEHIKILCEGDQDLYEFVWDTHNVSPRNPYVAKYSPDRFWSSVEAETVTFVDGTPDAPFIIDDEVGMPPLYHPRSDEE